MRRRLLSLWTLAFVLLCIRPALGVYFGYDCRERIPNGHRIPFQEHVAGYCADDQDEVGETACYGSALTVDDNPFGKDFAAAGYRWTIEVCMEDSDKDRQTNGFELGDPCCIWSEDVEMPQWMKNWPVSHPGFANSTQSSVNKSADVAALCKSTHRLKSRGLRRAGEDEMILTFEMDAVPLTVNNTTSSKDIVVFQNFIYNFPVNATYYIFGIERWFEDDAFLGYITKHELSSCREEALTEGPYTDLDSFADPCVEKMHMWNMGSRSPLILPRHAGFKAGKDSHRLAFAARMVYRAPRKELNMATIKTGLRFYATTTKRQNEVGVLRADFLVRTGLIPQDSKVALSSFFQIKVDHGIAPEGVKLLGYLPGRSQHYHTCKTWIERLTRRSSRQSVLHSLTELERDRDLGRDIEWFNDESDIYLRSGDYFSYTCMVDTAQRADSIELERCQATLYYYPAEALNQQIIYSGPAYITKLSRQDASYVSSATHMFYLSPFDTKLPLWRRLFLSRRLRCDPDFSLGISNTTEATQGVSDKLFQLRAPCRRGRKIGNFTTQRERLDYDCSEECAIISFNVMGCTLLHDAVLGDGEILSLFPTPLEAIGLKQCGPMFEILYRDYKQGMRNDLAEKYGIFGGDEQVSPKSAAITLRATKLLLYLIVFLSLIST